MKASIHSWRIPVFMHNKQLQYTVRVSETDPGLANPLPEQFGSPQGELAAAIRYFMQAVVKEDTGHKDMLYDIATEKLSRLEIIGTIVAILNHGVKGRLAEAVDEQAELYRRLNDAGSDSHVTQVLYGDDSVLTSSGSVPWTVTYIGSIGEPTANLCSDIVAEARTKIIYKRLINVNNDSDVRDTLGFLMTREAAHRKSFEKALYAIDTNFPPGKLLPVPKFNDTYFKISRSGPIVQAPWSSGTGFELVADPPVPVDGGDGSASVNLAGAELTALGTVRTRLASDPAVDSTTDAEFGEAKA